MGKLSVFGDSIWRVLWDPHTEPPTHHVPSTLYEELEKLGLNARAERHHYHGPHAETETDPLIQYSRFKIDFSGEKPKIVFTQGGSQYKDVWANPEKIHYDPEYYAIRGSLNFDRKTGKKQGNTSFIIWYRGIDGEGKRHLGIRFLGNITDQKPTSILVRSFDYSSALDDSHPHILLAHRGSWHADD